MFSSLLFSGYSRCCKLVTRVEREGLKAVPSDRMEFIAQMTFSNHYNMPNKSIRNLTALPLSWFWREFETRLRRNSVQLLTSVTWDSYSKTTISPTRGRDNFKYSLQLPSILSIPYLQVLVQSYEFVWAIFFNHKFERKMFTRRK